MNFVTRTVRPLLAWPRDLAARLHRDERGAISVMTVFAIFMLTLVLGMVFNIGRQIDDKVRMQNAADAAAYSGTLAVSRGLNSTAFMNHMECEVIALTAYMREARSIFGPRYFNDSENFMPIVFDTWQQVGNVFEQGGAASGFEKFKTLGQAIRVKLDYERKIVGAFTDMAREHSRMTLPIFEYILRGPNLQEPDYVTFPPTPNLDPEGGFIPRFQRAVLQYIPLAAQNAAQEIARRHTGYQLWDQHDDINLTAVMYRTSAERFDESGVGGRIWTDRILPIVDPSPSPPLSGMFDGMTELDDYYLTSRAVRDGLTSHYLESWIHEWMARYFTVNRNAYFARDGGPGRYVAGMSQLINFWRVFAHAHRKRLLEREFPQTNLPFMLRVLNPANGILRDTNGDGIPDRMVALAPDNQTLHDEYTFVAVVAWSHLDESFPAMFRNPLNPRRNKTYALTFAQATMFLPKSRFLRCIPYQPVLNCNNGGVWATGRPCGSQACPCNLYPLGCWSPYYDNWPGQPHRYQTAEWSAFDQNWRTRLEPVTTNNLGMILSRHPGGTVSRYSPPNARAIPLNDIYNVNMH